MSRKAFRPEAETVKKLLADKHREDLFIAECRIGWGAYRADGWVDGWAMKKSWAKPLTIGYEVKVSRSDFLHDDKWHAYLPYCNKFYFVCPYGVIKESEVPDGVGLMCVTSTGNRLYTKKKAPYREIDAGVLEPLYKGILMSRVIITERRRWNSRMDRTRLEMWEEFIKSKEEKRRYGTAMGGKLRKIYNDKISLVDQENKRLHDEIDGYKDLKKMLDEMGISPGGWCSSSVRRRLERDDIRQLDRQLDRLTASVEYTKKQIAELESG